MKTLQNETPLLAKDWSDNDEMFMQPFIFDPDSTPPTGPMAPLTQEQLDHHTHTNGYGILDPGVMPGAPALNY